MIYGKSRNVVVIQNIDSGYIEQAILILKKNPGNKEFFASEEGIVQEAQRIIDQYNQNKIKSKTNNLSKHPYFGWFLLGISVITSFCLFYLILQSIA
ncbi:MAG: hypothetical protein E7399_08335 [Ruminococcaceae bacterium]|nr:hypothetical protein [Oscillospiraceae bacterium]